MKKSAIGIGLLSLSALAVSSVSAYRGDPNVQGPNYSAERHEAMTQAFANRDYTSWFNLMSQNTRKGRVVDVVNADNFATFAEAHEKALAGDTEGSVALRAELGLGLRNGQGRGQYGQGRGRGNGQGKRNGQGNGQGRGQGRDQGNCPYVSE